MKPNSKSKRKIKDSFKRDFMEHRTSWKFYERKISLGKYASYEEAQTDLLKEILKELQYQNGETRFD